ncbi:MAG TPA: GH25 family lysozyme [Sphingobacteriaceae bacterium]
MLRKTLTVLSLVIMIFSVFSLPIPSMEKTTNVYAEVNYDYSEVNEVNAPEGFELHGIDVSRYQQHIDWEQVQDQDLISFAFIKATEGDHLEDSYFSRNWEETRSRGIKRGAYHFFRPEISGREQALLYLSVVDFEEGDFIPVLDIEVLPKGSRADWYQEIDTWLEVVEKETGKKAIIYSSRFFYTDYLEKRYSEHPRWIANYKRSDLPMEEWHFWQHTETAKIKGIIGSVDHNVFNGTQNELEQLCF